MDTMYREVNYDLLNLAKLVYSEGLTATLVLGDRMSKIFTAVPKYYTLTDFDVHIADSTENYKDRETIKALSVELIKAGLSDPEMAIQIVSAKSLTELKRYITLSTKTKKEENNIVGQLQQKVQEYEQQMKQVTTEFQKLQQENQSLLKDKSELEKAKIDIEYKRLNLEERKADNDKDNKDKIIDTKQQQIQAELAELSDNNNRNNEIKNII